MNENGVLTLLPWSAAGPVTRAAEGYENWIFRLSVDDSKSGEFLIRQAVDRGGCASVTLLLLDSGWGRVNEQTLTAALAARGMSPTDVLYFPATAGTDRALKLANDVRDSGADCAVLLASSTSGAVVANALHSTLPSFRLFSHWGILGGGFTEAVPHKARAALQISVLQTCGLRAERQGSPVLEQALRSANTDAATLAELPAPTGFVHGYDLTRVLLAAIKQAKADDDWSAAAITQKRAMVRKALQNITDPVVGILGTYNPPFTPYSQTNKDGHEALGLEDLCIARFVEDGRLTDGG